MGWRFCTNVQFTLSIHFCKFHTSFLHFFVFVWFFLFVSFFLWFCVWRSPVVYVSLCVLLFCYLLVSPQLTHWLGSIFYKLSRLRAKQFNCISRSFLTSFGQLVTLLLFLDFLLYRTQVVIISIIFVLELCCLPIDCYYFVAICFLDFLNVGTYIYLWAMFCGMDNWWTFDAWFINNSSDLLKLLLEDVVLVIAFDHVSQIGDRSLNISWNYLNWPKMVGFWQSENLWFLLISIFFLDSLHFVKLLLALHLTLLSSLLRINKPHLSGNGEKSQRALDDQLIKLIFEQILFHWYIFINTICFQFPHSHYRTDVKFINPMHLLVYT